MTTSLSPEYYHAHHGAFQDDLPFWLALARQSKGPILALGCGTGRVALPLAQAGFPVVGVDISSEMLGFLQARQTADTLALLQADFLRLPLAAQSFALAVLPCNTYTTIPLEARPAFLRGVARVLQPGGVFALSAPNPPFVATLPPEAEAEPEGGFRAPSSGVAVQVSSGWQREGHRWTVIWHYDDLHPDGRVHRHTVTQTHFLATLDTERGWFQDAAFTILQESGDFASTPWTPDAPYWVVTAQRG
ncbi:MAG: class I SAM-dependent methyltransferase [Chloroflexi bacterium]|nr:class I SAM-dependent methyltransferase [Chloroflexota bacterium]